MFCSSVCISSSFPAVFNCREFSSPSSEPFAHSLYKGKLQASSFPLPVSPKDCHHSTCFIYLRALMLIGDVYSVCALLTNGPFIMLDCLCLGRGLTGQLHIVPLSLLYSFCRVPFTNTFMFNF